MSSKLVIPMLLGLTVLAPAGLARANDRLTPLQPAPAAASPVGDSNDTGLPGTVSQPVRVTIRGSVESNDVTSGPLAVVQDGESMSTSFLVSTDNFVNSPNFSMRSYPIYGSSFALDFESASVGLQYPFPAGQTPYFAIRDNDPAVDGFRLTTNYFPPGVPTDVNGSFGAFFDNWYATYGGDTLPSLDILDALGTYDFTGLTVYHYSLDDGPVEAMSFLYEQLTIELTTEPWTDLGNGLAGVSGIPVLSGTGTLVPGSSTTLSLTNSVSDGVAWMVVGASQINAPFNGGTFVPNPDGLVLVRLDGSGAFAGQFRWPKNLPPGSHLWFQSWVEDGAALFGWAGSNALQSTQP